MEDLLIIKHHLFYITSIILHHLHHQISTSIKKAFIKRMNKSSMSKTEYSRFNMVHLESYYLLVETVGINNNKLFYNFSKQGGGATSKNLVELEINN